MLLLLITMGDPIHIITGTRIMDIIEIMAMDTTLIMGTDITGTKTKRRSVGTLKNFHVSHLFLHQRANPYLNLG